MDTTALMTSLAHLDSFFSQFAVAALLLVLFTLVYVQVTPFPEFRLIKEGKVAPAISFSGALLGFVVPLAGAIAHTVSLGEMVVWALIALIVQVTVFLLLLLFFRGISQAIANDSRAAAILLAALSLAAGILNAASMTY